MDNWKKEVINQFGFQHHSLFIVNDPDYLLNNEDILKNFANQGFTVIHFDDSISIRYLYETQYRESLERREVKLIFYTNDDNPNVFPFDFFKRGQHIHLRIENIFPKFSSTIVKQLDDSKRHALYLLQNQYHGSSSDKDTLEFIVKHIFKIVPELIDSVTEFYKLLFSIHYQKKEMPTVVKEYLVSQLSGKPMLHKLPVGELVHSASFFYQYMNQEWKNLIEKLLEVKKEVALEATDIYQAHPFTNPGIRPLMDDLFLEGLLQKVKLETKIDLPPWMKFGVIQLDNVDETISLLQKKIFDLLARASSYKDWIYLANLYSKYRVDTLKEKNESYIKEANTVSRQINEKFGDWLLLNYHSITSLPPFPKPKMVHQIVHQLASNKTKTGKLALIVMDGMSFVQWKRVKQALEQKAIHFEEEGVYAWVPTLTSVSRQAIFSGQMPMMFANSLRTTAKEESEWKLFWEDHGVFKQYVQYQKGLGKEEYRKEEIAAFKRPNIKVYGAVIDVVDSFVHRASQGEKSILAELEIWLETGYLYKLLKDLMENQFTVYITSDHGNTESIGIGRISEGVLVDQRGERVRVYSDYTIYQDSLQQIESIPWNNVGLPEDTYVLLAKNGQAFVHKNERIVSHGGISIEEVIVPFIKVIPQS